MHPRGLHVARQGVGQEVSVGQHHHPRPQRGQQILRQGLLPDRVRDKARPIGAPVPRLRCGRPADVGKRSARVPLDGREKYWLFSAVSGTSLVEPSIDATAARSRTPGAPDRRLDRRPNLPPGLPPGRRPRRTACAADRTPTWPSPGPGWRCGRPPPPPLPGIHPTGRIKRPIQQLPAPAAVIQPVDQLAHHSAVAAVAAAEQPQRQHEVHHQPGHRRERAEHARSGSHPSGDTLRPTRHAPPRDHPDRRSPDRAPRTGASPLRSTRGKAIGLQAWHRDRAMGENRPGRLHVRLFKARPLGRALWRGRRRRAEITLWG